VETYCWLALPVPVAAMLHSLGVNENVVAIHGFSSVDIAMLLKFACFDSG